jgi:hypothetical protein
MTASIVEALAGVTLMVWAGCTLMIMLSAVLHGDVLAGGAVDRPYGRARALAVRCGRPVHELVPVWQAVLFATSALEDPADAWWGGVVGSVLVLVVWLMICRIGVYNNPFSPRRAAWPIRVASRMARWVGCGAESIIVRLHYRIRPPRRAVRRSGGGRPEEEAAHWGEALAAMTVVLEVTTNQVVADRPDTGRAAIDGVVDDPRVVAAWRRASDPARANLLAGMVRYAVLVGVTASDLRPGCAAHDLLAYALATRGEPRPGDALFGPSAQRVTARAAALIADPAVLDREKRAVCAQLALALLGRGRQRGQQRGQST